MQKKHKIFHDYYKTESLYLSQEVKLLLKEIVIIWFDITTYRSDTISGNVDAWELELDERSILANKKNQLEKQIKQELDIKD